MKVLFVETHYRTFNGKTRTSAVDWWRIINPATHLKKNTDWEIEIRKGVLSRDDLKFGDPRVDFEWELIGRKFDVVWFSYIENGLAFAYALIASKKYGFKLVMDVDDNMLDPPPNHPYFQLLGEKEYKEALTIIKEVPYLSTTNSFLKKTYRELREDKPTLVLSNYIDLEVYKAKPHVEDDVITIGWQGGISHHNDLAKTPFFDAIKQILKKFKGKVRFEIIGGVEAKEMKELPFTQKIEGNPDFWEWIKIWEKQTKYWDIAVCPLEENNYNKGKSPIKTYEAGAAKLPVVVSDVGPYRYIRDGKTGFKCRTVGDWISALERLIQNKRLREYIGNNLYKEIKKNYTIQKNWIKWKEVIENLTKKK